MAYQARPSLTAWGISSNSPRLVEAREFILKAHLSFPLISLPQNKTADLTGPAAPSWVVSEEEAWGYK